MRILKKTLLLAFARKHADAEKSINTWKATVNYANWGNRQHVLADFPNAKIIKGNRARFEIKHNKYRFIAEILYEEQLVIVRFIGTHNEYENIDPATVSQKI